MKTEYVLAIIVGAVYSLSAVYIGLFDAQQFSEFGYPIHDGGDSSQYAQLAQNLAEYGEFTLSTQGFVPETFRTPLYSTFLAVTYSADRTFYLAVIVQILCAAASSILIFWIARQVVTSGMAVVVALLWALNPTTIFYSVILMSDVPFALLLLCSVFLLFVREQRTALTDVCAGALLGFSALMRPLGEHIAVLLLLSVATFSLFSLYSITTKRFVVVCLAVLMVVAPWYVRNSVYTGVPALSSTGAYTVLHFHVREFLIFSEGMSEQEADTKIAELIGGRVRENPTGIEHSAVYGNAARKIIAENILPYAMYHLVGSVNLFLSSSIRDTAINLPRLSAALSFVGGAEGSTSLKSLIVSDPLTALMSLFQRPLVTIEMLYRMLMVLFAVVSLWSLYAVPRARVIIVVSIVLVGYIAIATGPVSYPRYRIPAEPFLLIVAAVGIEYVHDVLRSRRRARDTLRAPAPRPEQQAT